MNRGLGVDLGIPNDFNFVKVLFGTLSSPRQDS